MSKEIKIALVSSFGGRWNHRLLAGGLRYAKTHGSLTIPIVSPLTNIRAVATELEHRGVDGIYGILSGKDFQNLDNALSHKIPIVNCGSIAPFQSATSPAADLNVYLDKALPHLKDSRLKSVGILLHAEDGNSGERFIGQFTETMQPTQTQASTLAMTVADNLITDLNADVRPVPEALAIWLQDLPKPAGILCPHLTSSSYLARCCAALGLRVPNDIAVAAPDDADSCLAGETTLASILPSVETMGTEAVRLLVRKLQATERPPQTAPSRLVEAITRKLTNRRRLVSDIAATFE